MSTVPREMADELEGCAAVPGSEPVGRADRDDGATTHELGAEEFPAELRDRLGDELIDQLLAGARTQEAIVGPGGLLAKLTNRLVERAMDAARLEELHRVEVGRDLISRVTDAVIGGVRVWQQRPLYPVVSPTAS
jgi:hypothetical protein